MTTPSELPSFLKENVFYRARLRSDSAKYNKDDKQPITECHPLDANLVSSKKFHNDRHTLMLDLDTEHAYVKSTCVGHGHLVFNTNLTLDAIVEILTVLTKHGIVQQGFTESTKDRGFSSIRPPGIHKGNPPDEAWFYDQDILAKSYEYPDEVENKKVENEIAKTHANNPFSSW